MKTLISTLRLSLVFQLVIYLLLVAVELSPVISEGVKTWNMENKKQLAAFIWTVKMSLIWTVLLILAWLNLYRLQRGSFRLYALVVVFMLASSVVDAHEEDFSALYLPLVASAGFVIALSCLTPLRRIVNMEGGDETSWGFLKAFRWATYILLGCSLFGATLTIAKSNEKRSKLKGWQKVEESIKELDPEKTP